MAASSTSCELTSGDEGNWSSCCSERGSASLEAPNPAALTKPARPSGKTATLEDGRSATRRWTREEHAKLEQLVQRYGSNNWTLIATHLQSRTGKQARQRWINTIRGVDADLPKRAWTDEEELAVATMHSMQGPAWSAIARTLVGRTENQVKNHWNTLLRSKFLHTRHTSVLATYVRLLKDGAPAEPATLDRAKAEVACAKAAVTGMAECDTMPVSGGAESHRPLLTTTMTDAAAAAAALLNTDMLASLHHLLTSAGAADACAPAPTATAPSYDDDVDAIVAEAVDMIGVVPRDEKAVDFVQHLQPSPEAAVLPQPPSTGMMCQPTPAAPPPPSMLHSASSATSAAAVCSLLAPLAERGYLDPNSDPEQGAPALRCRSAPVLMRPTTVDSEGSDELTDLVDQARRRAFLRLQQQKHYEAMAATAAPVPWSNSSIAAWTVPAYEVTPTDVMSAHQHLDDTMHPGAAAWMGHKRSYMHMLHPGAAAFGSSSLTPATQRYSFDFGTACSLAPGATQASYLLAAAI